ncbi:hypothetical protein V8D89_004638 [Ganoderma adspersum]
MATSADAPLSGTGLYDFHVSNDTKMVPFAGYSMLPSHYGSVGAVISHYHVRNSVGLFDVGHMVPSSFCGPTATTFLEWLTSSSFRSLAPYSSTSFVLLNEGGGIIDIPALPSAQTTPSTSSPTRVATAITTHGSRKERERFNLHVVRGGYTGEDSFEISILPPQTINVAQLRSASPVGLSGLGTRDSLRLEAGMCSYGQDLDEDMTPIGGWLNMGYRQAAPSSGLGFTREHGDFTGAEGVRKHLKNGLPRRRVSLTVDGTPARDWYVHSLCTNTFGAQVATPQGTRKKGIAVEVNVRNKLRNEA